MLEMKKIILLVFAAIITFVLLSEEPKKKKIKIEENKIITISVVGDLMCHEPQYEFAKTKNGNFDFTQNFGEIKKFLSNSDLTIGNLETVVEGNQFGFGSYPLFNAPVQYLDALKDAGFDLLITSNNHCLDRGIKGIKNTIDNLDSRNILHTGTYKSLSERDSVKIISIKGMKIVLLSYTYGVNGNLIPGGKKFLVNLIDTVLIKNDIAKIRKDVDVVLVYFHFGEEYGREPNKYQKEIVAKTILFGADLIIASHPHVIQPLEYFVPVKGKINKGFVAYSLGNFISNQRWRYSDCGVILNFRLEKKSTDKIILDSLWITPTWVFKGSVAGKKEFVILPDDTTVNKSFLRYLSKSEKDKMYQSFVDTKEIMNAHLK